MTAQTLTLAVWLAGAVAMFGWLLVNEWPTRHEDAREEGLPSHAPFLLAAFAVTALAWFAVPIIRHVQRSRS